MKNIFRLWCIYYFLEGIVKSSFKFFIFNRVGLPKLVEELVASGNVNAINVVNDQLTTMAYSAAPGLAGNSELGDKDRINFKAAIERQNTTSYVEGNSLRVVAPIKNSKGQVIGAVLVSLPIDHVQAAVRRQLELAILIAVVVLGVGVLGSAILARLVTGPVNQLTQAAASIEAGQFELDHLPPLTQRPDELGQLARVFRQMAQQVYEREQHLKQQVQELRIEIDQVKKVQEVAQVTGSEYFQALQREAAKLRQKRSLRKK